MIATYIPNSTLTWPDIWDSLYMDRQHAGRKNNRFSVWSATSHTPECVTQFLEEFGLYDRVNNSKLSTVLLHTGFAKYLVEQEPELAVKIGIAIEIEL